MFTRREAKHFQHICHGLGSLLREVRIIHHPAKRSRKARLRRVSDAELLLLARALRCEIADLCKRRLKTGTAKGPK